MHIGVLTVSLLALKRLGHGGMFSRKGYVNVACASRGVLSSIVYIYTYKYELFTWCVCVCVCVSCICVWRCVWFCMCVLWLVHNCVDSADLMLGCVSLGLLLSCGGIACPAWEWL